MNKIKEFKADDEDELLYLVYQWTESDPNWHIGGEWIFPKSTDITMKRGTKL